MGYKSTYNEEPPRLTTLAYDATALAAALAKRGARFDQAALTNPNGFAGLDGIFRLKPNGEVERGLAILEITSLGSDVIDSAPPSFAAIH
jgi:ABC-type branched-subunit amino acid transport system substrate-binding protein